MSNNGPDMSKTPPSKDTQAKTTPRPTHHRNASSNPNLTSPTPLQQQHHLHHHHRRQQSQSTTIPTTPLRLQPTTENDSPLHFSPSKARAAAQQSHQLAVLKRWLDTLLPESPGQQNAAVARWEAEHRALGATNPELAAAMVRWLQQTMHVNRAADERRRLLFEAKTAELEAFRVSRRGGGGRDEHVDVYVDGRGRGPEGSVGEGLVREIDAALTDRGRDSLDSLAATGVSLGHIPDMNVSASLGKDFGRAVVEFTLQVQDLQSHIESLETLQRVLEKRLEQAQAQLTAFNEEKDTAAKAGDVMHPQTAQWNREVKQIAIKINEYKDRVAALERSRPGLEGGRVTEPAIVKIEDVIEKQDRVNEKKATVARLEETLRSLSGLPPDLEASRIEVKRAKTELERLRARREELFGILAGR